LYAIVDIETTGGHAAANGITEIAIYVHDGSRITDEYHSLVNPGRKIPAYITALTGISNAMVAGAPLFADIAADIYALLQDNVFIAHNVNFDFSFIRHHLREAGLGLHPKKLCTVRLSRKVFPGLASYSLGNLCRSLGIPIENRHRAGGDARATVTLFERLLSEGAGPHIEKMLKKTSSEQWLPLQLDKQVIESLPSSPGVYYFHDSKGKVIYVGKAINVKKRVSSHFTHNDAEKKRQHFLRQVAHISSVACAGELHALVLESTEIRKLWPRYNYSQKQPLQKYGLYAFEDNRGYIRLAIDKKKKNLPALYQFNLLHEGLVMLKKMTEEFELDARLCHLDKTRLSDSDLDQIGKPADYNCKVKTALEALEKQLPTFAVVENGLTSNDKLYMLIERGSFWGMGYLSAHEKIKTLEQLKERLEPYSDNDFIRNSIYSFVETHPGKKMILET
jgi:DNA polymerase-3 subunit epsilon